MGSQPPQRTKKIFHDELIQVATAMDEYCPGYSNALNDEMGIIFYQVKRL